MCCVGEDKEASIKSEISVYLSEAKHWQIGNQQKEHKETKE